MKKIVRFIRRMSERVLIWSLCREAEYQGWRLPTARRIAEREVTAVRDSLRGYFYYLDDERAIIAARLQRRFDPGMVLNEVTQRAAEHRKEVREGAMGLSDRQLAALKVQREHLERIARGA